MDLGTRFVHTADWQIGLRAAHIPGDDGAAIRNARFEVVERIAGVAKDADADFVVVAGDVFEHHGLRRESLQRTFEALRTFRCPVFLLPGNHDPFTPDALYRTEWWERECPDTVRVLGRREPLDVGRATLLPSPLLERHTQDPTAWLTDRVGPRDRVRVGVAHGAVKEFLAGKVAPDEIHNDIPLGLADRARLDYLALGDWHGKMKVNERTWYSGTPEATSFSETQPGEVLVVAIDGPGAAPQVTPTRVARYDWRCIERTLFTADDVAALERELADLPDRRTTLVEVVLRGQLDLTLYGRVHTELRRTYEGRFHHIRFRDADLQVKLTDSDVDRLPHDGWMGKVVQRLRAGIENERPEDCQRALHELYRLHLTLRTAGGVR